MKHWVRHIGLIFIIISSILYSCSKEKMPVLSTSEITDITGTTALSGGKVTDQGSGTVLTRGVCWSMAMDPTIEDNKTENGSGEGAFSSHITGLNLSTTYYVRAYAGNSIGTSYGNQLSFTTYPVLFDTSVTYSTISDIEGNIYKTLQIGSQEWMAENLKATMYNDGTEIPNAIDDATWIGAIAEAYCDYDNNPVNCNIYGRLYNFNVAASTNQKNICPTGWHVPGDHEWNTLVDYLGGESVAGGKLKETKTIHWLSPNTGATNESGFTAVPGGYRGSTGSFSNINYHGQWWTSAKISASGGLYFGMTFEDSSVSNNAHSKSFGLSIRCVKDI
jgi:uncharacterized protein (TIGR02145 family)